MKRIAARLLAAAIFGVCVFVLIGRFWSVIFGPDDETSLVPDPVTISNFHAEIVVNSNGDLDATETITADFPAGRHGIFRYWDVTSLVDPKVRQIPEIVSITVDGAATAYEVLDSDRGRIRVARIGDPQRYVEPGAHSYVIRYRIAGVLESGNAGEGKQFATSTGDLAPALSVFLWNVIAPGWGNHIEAAEVTIRLPAAVSGAQCAIGYGEPERCPVLTFKGDTVTVETRALQPRTPVTVRVGVDLPTPARNALPWSSKWDGLFGNSVMAAWWAGIVTVGAAVTGWLIRRSIREPRPPYPLQYSPPEQLGPVQVEFIRTEHVPTDALSATAFYLAEHRLITLDESAPKRWVITGVGAPEDWAKVDEVSVVAATALGVAERGSQFRADGTAAAGQRLAEARSTLTEAVRKWAIDGGLIVESERERWLLTVSFLLVGVIGIALIGWFREWVTLPLMWLAPVVVYVCVSLPAMLGAVTRRTPAGRELWSKAGGFHRLLATDSAESRFDFAAHKDLYTAFIPYAVAAGSAAAWAKKFEKATGQPAPRPIWFGGSTGARFASGAVQDSFDAALSSSLAAYKSDRSASGGSGGGGFGGGRGGGGSW